MDRRNFLQGIMAAAAAVASGVRPAVGGTGIQATVSAATAGFTSDISDAVRAVCGLLRECRIEQVIRKGDHLLQITYVRDGKRRHDGPLFDWIEANAHPRNIMVSTTAEGPEMHLGEYVSFPITPIVEVEVEWFVADIEHCPIFGYREVTT